MYFFKINRNYLVRSLVKRFQTPVVVFLVPIVSKALNFHSLSIRGHFNYLPAIFVRSHIGMNMARAKNKTITPSTRVKTGST